MNLLLIHNNYGAFSGEEAVIEKQLALFRRIGYHVDELRRDSAESRNSLRGHISAFINGFYSREAVRSIKQLLEKKKPDIVVIHNLYPFISPAILKHIKKAGVPIIMTVHNYRLICPTGLFMRNYKPCELCLGTSEWNCIKYNCEYSLPKSIAYAARNWYARKTKAYIDHIDKYACITYFQTIKLQEAGFDQNKLHVIPNFLDHPVPFKETEGEYIGISARLSKEKGIELILEVARRTPDIRYIFAGAQGNIDLSTETIPENCTFAGYLSHDELNIFYQKSKFLLVGSLWYEGFPMTILEASQQGKATIGPAHAGFLEIIDNEVTGLHYIPGNADDMERKVRTLWYDDSACQQMGANAYQKLVLNYTSEAVKDKWKNILA